ncbi:MAG TPA: tetratricopeptide repeat protein [Planctomycetota bacterium]
MDPRLSRAALLLEQSRYDLAESELRLALAEDPDNGRLHSFLAVCLAERKELEQAQTEADRGVALEPDFPGAHFMRAQILRRRKRLDEAMEAAGECLRLDPEQPSPRALRAAIHLERQRWKEALEEAEIGLTFDAEDPDCGNMRAIALTQLGRRAEAAASLGAALERDPENDVTHANRGWGLLHEGDPRKAMEHFREALRLDPTNAWARAGIVEALKARNPVYGLMLRFFLWMGRLSGRAQWGIMIGGYLAYRGLIAAAERSPAAKPWLMPLIIGYMVFAALTWVASPVFNLALRLHPLGKHALTAAQRRESTWIGGLLGTALAALGVWLWTDSDYALLLTFHAGLMVIPLASTLKCEGRARRLLGWATLGLLGLAATTWAFLVPPADVDQALRFMGYFAWGVLATGIAAPILAASLRGR